MSLCPYCGKTVYTAEKQPGTGDDKSWHVRCWQAWKRDQQKQVLTDAKYHAHTPFTPKKEEQSKLEQALPYIQEASAPADKEKVAAVSTPKEKPAAAAAPAVTSPRNLEAEVARLTAEVSRLNTEVARLTAENQRLKGQ